MFDLEQVLILFFILLILEEEEKRLCQRLISLLLAENCGEVDLLLNPQ